MLRQMDTEVGAGEWVCGAVRKGQPRSPSFMSKPALRFVIWGDHCSLLCLLASPHFHFQVYIHLSSPGQTAQMPPHLGVNLRISSSSHPSSSEFSQLCVLPLCFSSSYCLVLLLGTRHFIPMSLQATWEQLCALSPYQAPCIMWGSLGQTLLLFQLLMLPSSLWVSRDWVHDCLAGATVPNSFAARHGPTEFLQRAESKSQAIIHFPFLVTE